MKKLAFLVFFAMNVHADTETSKNEAILNNSASNLIHIEGNVLMLVTPIEHEGFREVDYEMVITEELKDILITVDKAREMGLRQTSNYFLTTQTGFNEIFQQVIEKVKKDNPKFFSIQYYQHTVENGDVTEYSAHVIEYE